MRYSLNLAAAAAAYLVCTAVAIDSGKCPGGHVPVEFEVDIVGINGKNKGLILDHVPINTGYSLLNAYKREVASTRVNGFRLANDGSLTIYFHDPDGSAGSNSNFDIALFPVPVSESKVPKLTQGDKEVPGWKPVMAVRGVQPIKFKVVSHPLGQFLVCDDREVKWRGWALCKTDAYKNNNVTQYPVLAWTENGDREDFSAGNCERVDLKVVNCKSIKMTLIRQDL